MLVRAGWVIDLSAHGVRRRSRMILSRQGTCGGDVCRMPVIVIEVGSSVSARRLLMLGLEGGCSHVRLVAEGAFLRGHGVVDAARATAVGDVIVVDDGVVHDDRVVDVGVVNDGGVYADNVSVICECAATPNAAGETDSHIAEAVVHTAVVADVRAPVAGMPDVKAAAPAPITRGPKSANIWRGHPCARNPVITIRAVGPIAGGPHKTWLRARGLNVDRQNRGTEVDADEHSGIRGCRDQGDCESQQQKAC